MYTDKQLTIQLHAQLNVECIQREMDEIQRVPCDEQHLIACRPKSASNGRARMDVRRLHATRIGSMRLMRDKTV